MSDKELTEIANATEDEYYREIESDKLKQERDDLLKALRDIAVLEKYKNICPVSVGVFEIAKQAIAKATYE